MKNVVIFHGTSETEESFWFPWLRNRLEQAGCAVSIPRLPGADDPDISLWLPAAMNEKYTPETILIGHSAGGSLQLSVLENLEIKIRQAIIVSGYARPVRSGKAPEKILQASYDWDKIANNADDIIIINSDNDPWGCDDVEGRYMLDQLEKGKLIIPKGQGHMGSDLYNQPYAEFPFLLKLIDYETGN